MDSTAYVALKVDLEGFPDAHITAMYAKYSPLPLERVKGITEAILQHSNVKTVSIYWDDLVVLGSEDKWVLAVKVNCKPVQIIHDTLQAAGLRHSYPKLTQHISLTPEVPYETAEYLRSLLLKVFNTVSREHLNTYANLRLTPIVEEISE